MHATQTILALRGVSKSYPGPAGTTLDVLKGVDLELAGGQSAAITGPSGSGKSTLLNLIGALDIPTAGTVCLRGRELAGLDEDARSDLRAQDIGFVFQKHLLLPQCSVLENVLVPCLACPERSRGTRPGVPLPEDRARDLLGRAGLADRLHHRPGQLSGGECQRVAVARAFIHRPSLVLADEPTGALDGDTARRVVDLLLDLNRTEGVALVVVTHALDLARRLDAVYRLDAGRLAPVP